MSDSELSLHVMAESFVQLQPLLCPVKAGASSEMDGWPGLRCASPGHDDERDLLSHLTKVVMAGGEARLQR